MNKENEPKKCDCGKGAKWLYMPGFISGANPFVCEECIGRGCSCNHRNMLESYEELPTEEDGVEGVDWKWIEKDKIWTTLDEKGREWPCCEYEYDTDEDNFADL